jgi:nucleotide-binding universal stress UspA family protein
MTPMVTHILLATDLSHNSTYALRHAAYMAKATGAKLHVLHVNEPLSDDAQVAIQMFMQDKVSRQEALNTRAKHVKAILTERQKNFWAAMPVEDRAVQDQIESIEVIEGHPPEVILRRSRELGCDLIVLGGHSHGLAQVFLGSVAKRVLRRATVPTLVVPCQVDN